MPAEIVQQDRVLLIEDDPGDSRLVEEVLKKAGRNRYFLETASTLAEGLKKLSEQSFDVILLDLSLPDSFGVSTVDQVIQKAQEKAIIVLTGAKDEQLALEAGKKGAQDYLVKSEIPGGVLPRSIAYAIERKQAESKLRQTANALNEANQKILEQQNSVIEEERLKVLLQMAGAASHELNQPLMALLGSIEIMRLVKGLPQRLCQHLDRIDEASRRIAEIIKKMSTIRKVESRPYAGGKSIINLNQKIRILYVEDSDEDYKMFQALLADQGSIDLFRADSMADAVPKLTEGKYDLVFIDYMLPDCTGIDIIQWMNKEALDTPAISVTGCGNEVIATRMIKSGAYDYLPKSSLNHDVLARCIFKALEKYKLKKEIVQANAKMVEMATRDPLTGLYNRYSMTDFLGKEFHRAKRYGSDLACLLMDLDFFKKVNDANGHQFGDHVLKQFAQRLTQNLRDTDLCFRYGGEEFMVLLPSTPIDNARQAAEKIRHACESQIYDDGDISANVTVSIGVATVSALDPRAARDLLAFADKALYRAKATGRNRVVIYQKSFWNSNTENNFRELKDRLAAVLEKTKKVSVESLELMVWDREEDRFRGHNHQVMDYLSLISTKLNFNASIVDSLHHAAVFHDATKALLGNVDKARPLNEDEKAQIITHPYKLHELIEPFDVFAEERSVLLRHHEHYDGNGYPDGLKGDEIPIGARIFAIIDAFVAMTSQRSYRSQYSIEEAVQELTNHAGTQFDPILVETFIDALRECGTVGLSDETVAVVKAKLDGAKSGITGGN